MLFYVSLCFCFPKFLWFTCFLDIQGFLLLQSVFELLCVSYFSSLPQQASQCSPVSQPLTPVSHTSSALLYRISLFPFPPAGQYIQCMVFLFDGPGFLCSTVFYIFLSIQLIVSLLLKYFLKSALQFLPHHFF